MSSELQFKKRNFYGSESKDTVVLSAYDAGHTDIPVDKLESQVSIYEPLLDTFHDLHQSVKHFYRSAELEYGNVKHASKNELNNAKEYLNQRFVFGNEHEINEKLVPSIFYSLIGFYSGRIITNQNNWNSVLSGTKSTLGKVSTSLPSRLLLPVFLGAYTFQDQTPKTYERVQSAVKEDVLHKDHIDFIDTSKSFINEGCEVVNQFGKTAELRLQLGIHNIRKFCVENWPF